MITRIRLGNFKLHTQTLIDAAPITVFIGPNNSGKSSLLQAVLALRQAASSARENLCQSAPRELTSDDQPYFFGPNKVIDIGEFEDVVRHGEREIRIGLSGVLEAENVLEQPIAVRLEFEVHVRGNRLAYHAGHVDCSYGRFDWRWSPGQAATDGSIRIEAATLDFSTVSHFGLIGYSSVRPGDLPAEKVTAFHDLGRYLGSAPIRLLNSLHPIFPLRGFEEWGYPLPKVSAGNLDRSTLPDRAVALASILAYDREMERKVSSWLEELIRVRIEVKLLPGKRVTIRSKSAPADIYETPFINEGTGANQLPFILVPIGLTPPKETIFLCEPEAHLHPKAQSDLASVLLEIATREGRQFLIETHSEHILHALLHAVATGTLEKDQLIIYYFENVNGVVQVTPLEITPTGQVKGGLPGFFQHSLTELAEYLEALKKP